jgi:hypothetical protein
VAKFVANIRTPEIGWSCSRVIFGYAPDPDSETFLGRAKQTIENAGFGFVSEILGGAEFDNGDLS